MDYAAFLSLAADYDDESVTLTGTSVALFLCLARQALSFNFWTNGGEPLTSVQFDDIEAKVSQAIGELM